ncbi:hypothetical protein V3C99_018269 [Haemonchus contortus]|uniref:DUF222 domain-containing protein n=1 Tax=Haemonchus contortus TaxID=6289 RepID=A0A7I4Z568_HAECO
MTKHDGADQTSQRNERALAATHEICCPVCGDQQWYEYQMNRLTEAVAIAQAQAQAEAAYSRQLHSERQILEIAFGEAINRMCRVRQRLEVLSNIADDTAVKGRHAKALRDATVNAINGVRTESEDVADMLTHWISQGTSSLLADLNNTFATVGCHENAIRFVDTSAEGLVPHRLRALDGAAREKVEELPLDDRESYDAIVARLRMSFEGPHHQHRYMARQALSACKQQTGESSAAFANRLLTWARADTTGQDPATQKERVLEEFVAHLRPDIRGSATVATLETLKEDLLNPGTIVEAPDTSLLNAHRHGTSAGLQVPLRVLVRLTVICLILLHHLGYIQLVVISLTTFWRPANKFELSMFLCAKTNQH